MPPPDSTVDDHYYESVGHASFAEKLMIRARRRMFDELMAFAQPGPTTTVLDIGVSDVLGEGANFLERHYRHPHNITAAGLGAAAEFQGAFPQIRYRQIVAGEPLPFDDDTFDVAVSNAVLEHVGSAAAQRAFIAEALRVAKAVFITVPNRFFPVEHHTKIPFAHWGDRPFAAACRLTGKSDWANREQLILMSKRRLRAAAPADCPGAVIGHTGLRLGVFSSNLVFAARRQP